MRAVLGQDLGVVVMLAPVKSGPATPPFTDSAGSLGRIAARQGLHIAGVEGCPDERYSSDRMTSDPTAPV
jgi:hypothetical protein